MCRFVLYLGPPLTLSALFIDPSHSLIHQSFHANERDEPLNGDGFGVAWYVPELSPQPAAFRSISPAWNNRNLVSLARVTRSHCILAHVRAATQGFNVGEANCHPFTVGPYAFMHNGDLGGFGAIRRRLLSGLSDAAFASVLGGTDSEHLFALAIDRLPDEPVGSAEHLADALVGAVERALALTREAGCEEHSYLNIALSNGKAAVACRFTTDDPAQADSLYLHTGRRYVCEGGVCRMIAPEAGQGAAIVSSEPLSDDLGWTSIPANHLVLIHPDRTAELRAWTACGGRQPPT